jgi:hypothetical protein
MRIMPTIIWLRWSWGDAAVEVGDGGVELSLRDLVIEVGVPRLHLGGHEAQVFAPLIRRKISGL